MMNTEEQTDRQKAQTLGKRPSVQQRDGEWGYLHPFNAKWHGGFTTRALAREARNAVKGAEPENGDIEVVHKAPVFVALCGAVFSTPDIVRDHEGQCQDCAALAAPPVVEPEATPVTESTPAPKPSGAKWKPTQADILEVRRRRLLGHSFRKIDEDMGWPPSAGNRSFRIVKGSWNFEDLEK